MNYWINSNSGDYVIQDSRGHYTLYLISRSVTDENGQKKYLFAERIEITPTQFSSLKGFIPIKRKKLFNNRTRKIYAPTLSDGTKGESKRVSLPTKADSREEILKSLGL